MSLMKPQSRLAFVALPTFALLAAVSAASAAEDALKGIWALNARECAIDEGPSSRMFIDLGAREKDKPAPIVDRYENHCRVLGVNQAGASYSLRLRCYEFWDDYRANQNSSRSTMKIIVRSANALIIDGAAHVRCKK